MATNYTTNYSSTTSGMSTLPTGVTSPSYTIPYYTTTNASGTNEALWEGVSYNELRSKSVAAEEHAHSIECRLRVESTKVTSEYYCKHCNEVLFSKVISEIPKSLLNKKCLSRIVKSV